MKLIQQIPDDVDIDTHEKTSRPGCVCVIAAVLLFWIIMFIIL